MFLSPSLLIPLPRCPGPLLPSFCLSLPFLLFPPSLSLLVQLTSEEGDDWTGLVNWNVENRHTHTLVSRTSQGNPFDQTLSRMCMSCMNRAGHETKMYLPHHKIGKPKSIVPNIDQVSLSIHYSIMSSHQVIPINTAIEDNPSCQGFSRYELFLLTSTK